MKKKSKQTSNIAHSNDSWVVIHRSLASDKRSGKITSNEYFVLVWLTNTANMFGISTTSFEDIRMDMFNGKTSINWINKIFLSLKSQNYIQFEHRRGRRGSFEVLIDNFLLSTGKFTDLSNAKKQNQVRGEYNTNTRSQSDANTELQATSQNFEVTKRHIYQGFSIDQTPTAIRSHNNDNEKEKDKYIIDSKNSNKRIDIKTFNAQSSDEQRCLEIAQALSEIDMRFILSAYKKYGMLLIERAYALTKETFGSKTIKNRGAYFNTIIQQIVKEDHSFRGNNAEGTILGEETISVDDIPF